MLSSEGSGLDVPGALEQEARTMCIRTPEADTVLQRTALQKLGGLVTFARSDRAGWLPEHTRAEMIFAI